MIAFIVHRFKRVRFLLLVVVTFVLLFYYSFLNEEHELNAHLEEDELPLITKPPAQLSQVAPKKGFQELLPDHHAEERLSDPKVLLEKNKYFPIYEKEPMEGRKKGMLPEDYFDGQKKFTLRDRKKKERYPIGKENYFRIPKLVKPETYPIIQSVKFTDGGVADPQKLNRIKAAFESSWKIYKDNAYGHDEVTPISKQPSDPFNGWAATLIDSLDVLLLMDEKAEFIEAVNFIQKINFKQSFREDIPIFENVIRILAGLISSYDLSQNDVVLKSAVELAGLIMEAFDTPNRFPLLYYKWRNPIDNRFASNDGYLAEVGSLGLEFTRLSQITGDMKYYDAITRITNTFERSKDKFHLKGLFPNNLDLSGCTLLNKVQIDNGLHLNNHNVIKTISNGRYVYCLKNDEISSTSDIEYYSMGGLADSFYEYLPKMYHLLRGEIKSSTVYKDFYLGALKNIKSYMLFQPKMPDVDPNIRFISSIAVKNNSAYLEVTQDLDMQHLTCFAGGMIALGAKLFSQPEDLKIAEQVTLGCYDLYKRFGVMPERIAVDKMADPTDVYDEKARLKYIEDNKVTLRENYNGADNFRGSNGLSNGPKSTNVIPSRHRDGTVNSNANDNINAGNVKVKGSGEEKISKSKRSFQEPEEDKEFHPKLKNELSKTPELINTPEIEPKSTSLNGGKVIIKSKLLENIPPLIDGVWRSSSTYNRPIWTNELVPSYILRPEVIESVFYMYRITGDSSWRDKGWEMWLNIERFCKNKDGIFTSIRDITIAVNGDDEERVMDSMESFWFAETLKYFYLLFNDAGVWSLDDVVLNTEAHAFKLVG